MAETQDKKSGHELRPMDHFNTLDGYIEGIGLVRNTEPEKHIASVREHFIRDLNDTQMQDPRARLRPVQSTTSKILNASSTNPRPVFSGATTNINPFNDPEKKQIIDYGLSNYEESRFKVAGDYKPPLSPLYPFTRMIDIKSRNDHQISNLTAFNRYHLPVADLEHRKAFRHVFFTRPECYVMCKESGKVALCQQAEFDEDFNTSYSRMPYITKLLAPVYVSGTFGRSSIPADNFNYLLSNRCMGLSPTGNTLSTYDSVGKSIQGYTVTPGMHYEGRQGSTISVTFRDTKYLEVYEYFRMWMLYIWKIKYGIFAPSFNGYKYANGFPSPGKLSDKNLHPFDRALEYTCSMFDFITDESDLFVRYWCKYYGMYPIDLQVEGLSNTNNDALKNEMTVTVTFKYQYKLEDVTKSLIEFNINAGICDRLGKPNARGLTTLKHSDQFKYFDDKGSLLMKQYMGPGAGFVGTPYVVMMNVDKDLFGDMSTNSTVWPCLRFSPISSDTGLNQRINMSLESVHENKDPIYQSDTSAVAAAAAETAVKIENNKAEENTIAETIRSGTVMNVLDTVDDAVTVHLENGTIGGAAVKFVENGGFGEGAAAVVNLVGHVGQNIVRAIDEW